MYGAGWCSDCRRSKALLDRLDVDYTYVDVEASAANADAAKSVSGQTHIPVVVFPDGEFQVEPTDAALESKLRDVSAIA